MRPLPKKTKKPEIPSTSFPTGKGKETLTHTPKILKSIPMNCIIWNTRRANNAEFRRHCKFMIRIHMSIMLALLVSKMADHKYLFDKLGF